MDSEQPCTNNQRGVIRNRQYATQVRDFSGLRFGNITPMDIDGMIEYHNKCNEFIKEYQIDLSAIAYIDGDGMTTKRFWDRGLASKFAFYHRQHARLISMPIEDHKAIPVMRFKP